MPLAVCWSSAPISLEETPPFILESHSFGHRWPSYIPIKGYFRERFRRTLGKAGALSTKSSNAGNRRYLNLIYQHLRLLESYDYLLTAG